MANGNIADGKLGSPNREQNGMLRERHRLSELEAVEAVEWQWQYGRWQKGALTPARGSRQGNRTRKYQIGATLAIASTFHISWLEYIAALFRP